MKKTRWPTARESFCAICGPSAKRRGAPDLIVVTAIGVFRTETRIRKAASDPMRLMQRPEQSRCGSRFPAITICTGRRKAMTAKGLRQYDEDPALRRAGGTHGSDTQRYLRKLFSDYERFFKDRILSDWQARQSELSLTYSLGQLPGSFLLRVQKRHPFRSGRTQFRVPSAGRRRSGRQAVRRTRTAKDDLPRFVDGCVMPRFCFCITRHRGLASGVASCLNRTSIRQAFCRLSVWTHARAQVRNRDWQFRGTRRYLRIVAVWAGVVRSETRRTCQRIQHLRTSPHAARKESCYEKSAPRSFWMMARCG